MTTEEAPGDLELVRRFVNTLDVDEGTDALARPESAAAWLTEAGLLGSAAGEVGQHEHRLALAAREGLRALMAASSHPDADFEAIAALDGVADAVGLTLRFAPEQAELVPRAEGVVGALGRLLVLAAAAMADGSWSRLKLCRDDACAWAYYDHSRNRSGRWCSMEGCGNRAKVRAYRARSAG